MTTANPAYSASTPMSPARLEIDYPPGLSRLLIFVKWLLAIPHYFVLAVLGIGAYVVLIISFFAVLITGRYPEGMFNYMVGVIRYSMRLAAYLFLMTDAYPPFSLADDPGYPVRLQIDYPGQMARWRPLVNWLLALPALVAVYVLAIVAYIVTFLAWFAILFTGRFPEPMFDTVAIYMRWNVRTMSFVYWMTEQYPPFVWA
jgi:hypothetical protein